MKKAWYILNYHNISWEENALLRPIGGSFSPDLFEEHIVALQNHFEIVGINEGYTAFSQGSIRKPLLSIWFDDGLAGCRTYAEPILSHYGLSAAMYLNPCSAKPLMPALASTQTSKCFKQPINSSIL